MSSRHEHDLVVVLDGKGTLNSGATWRDPSDGHQTLLDQHYRFAWDGKSTLGASIGVTKEMWSKAVEQSRNLDTLLPLRFYANERLTEVDLDLVVLDLDVFAQVLADANTYRAMLADTTHLIDFHDNESGDWGWVIQHPASERINGTLFDCPMAKAIPQAEHYGETLEGVTYGRFQCSLNEGWIVVGEPVEVEDGD